MRTFVMGDIHGAHRALRQCLERAGFDRTGDRLVQLGDVADGFDEVDACVDELLNIPRLVAVRGNHDEWFREFLACAYHPALWNYGGAGTARSYLNRIDKKGKIIYTGKGYKTALEPIHVPENHRRFFSNQRLYFVDENGNCFVHAGFEASVPFERQQKEIFYWDRELWANALATKPSSLNPDFAAIFLGHTPTLRWNTDQPMKAGNIYNLDTGCGTTGRLTIMDVETKEWWQSDPVRKLYKRV